MSIEAQIGICLGVILFISGIIVHIFKPNHTNQDCLEAYYNSISEDV